MPLRELGTTPGRQTLDGFQTFKASNVQVTINQVVRTNAVLQPGGVTESVTVEAAAAVLATDSAAVSESIRASRTESNDEAPALDGRFAMRWSDATTR